MQKRFSGIWKPICLIGIVASMAGCAKYTKCKEATTEAECNEEYFEKGKFKCKWNPEAYNDKGGCLKKEY